MKRIPFLFLLATIMISAAVPATIKLPVANMFRAASADTDVVSQAIFGTNVQVLEEKPGWARIETPDAYTGWVEASTLVKSATPYGTGANVLRINALFSHLYREPDLTKHAPLLTVPFETTLELIVKKDARWAQVRLPDDRSAWVQLGDAGLTNEALTIPQMIELSKRFLGLPYTWGGTSSFGFDCSGYTQMLCRRRKIFMPRDADQQAFWTGMDKVDQKNLQPGDLLYFGKSIDHITHTGLYIGRGEFINATTAGKPIVQISVLAEPQWTKLLVAIRRPKEKAQ